MRVCTKRGRNCNAFLRMNREVVSFYPKRSQQCEASPMQPPPISSTPARFFRQRKGNSCIAPRLFGRE